MVDISVIIRTKNSGKTIKTCLYYLKKQTIKVDEVIIVDSGSTDNTLGVANDYNCIILRYPEEPFNYSKAINIGVNNAKNQAVLILSSHVYMNNIKSLEFMYHYLYQNEMVSAVSSYPFRKGRTQDISSLKNVKWNFTTLSTFKGATMSNACALIKKKYWREYNFNIEIPAAEDQDWILYHMKYNNLGHVSILSPYVEYKNPYINERKRINDYIAIGRYIYPNYFLSKTIIRILTIRTISKIIKGDFKGVLFNYKLVYYIIREKIGLGIKLSLYNKI